jgi:hypothetical protein
MVLSSVRNDLEMDVTGGVVGVIEAKEVEVTRRHKDKATITVFRIVIIEMVLVV